MLTHPWVVGHAKGNSVVSFASCPAYKTEREAWEHAKKMSEAYPGDLYVVYHATIFYKNGEGYE